MIVRKCDRCGTCYEPYRDNGKHKIASDVNGIAFVYIKTNGGWTGMAESASDLCPACLDAVYQFVRSNSAAVKDE